MRSSAPLEFLHRSRRGIGHRACALPDRASQAPSRPVNALLVGHLLWRRCACIERGVDFGKIPDVRPVQHGSTEPDRLDRILPAVACQRTAHEHDRRQPVDQPEFAERVGDVDVDVSSGSSPRERSAGFQARGLGDFGDALAALGMTRRDARSAASGYFARSRRCASMTAASSPACVEAAAITGARADDRLELRKVAASAGGGGTSSLRLPVELTRGAPSSRIALRVDGRLREAKIEPRRAARRSTPGTSRQRLNERSDTRPLTRIIGMRRCARRQGSGSATDRIRRTARGPAASDRGSARRSAARRAE